MTTLTTDFILEKTKATSLEDIKNLNLWGSELQNVSVLACLPNVTVISLSVNRVNDLEPFGACSQLQELYLRKNEVRSLDELRHLEGLEGLRVLWLCDNPCAQDPDYRAQVLRRLPQLQKLDHTAVSQEERQAAQAGMPFVPENKESAATARPPPRAPSPSSSSSPAPYPAPPASAPPQFNPQQDPSAKKPPSSNILYAVMALLGELDDEALRIVYSEVGQKLSSNKDESKANG